MQVFLDDRTPPSNGTNDVWDASPPLRQPFHATYDDGGEISDVEANDSDDNVHDVVVNLEQVQLSFEKLNLNRTLEREEKD